MPASAGQHLFHDRRLPYRRRLYACQASARRATTNSTICVRHLLISRRQWTDLSRSLSQIRQAAGGRLMRKLPAGQRFNMILETKAAFSAMLFRSQNRDIYIFLKKTSDLICLFKTFSYICAIEVYYLQPNMIIT